MELGNFHLNWDGFQENLNTELKCLREDFLDVTLVCDDEQISAHKVILSASSEFFRSILRRNAREFPLIYLKGVKMTLLKSIMDFIYTGEVEIAENDLSELLEIAFELKIKGLSNRRFPKNEPKEQQTQHVKPKNENTNTAENNHLDSIEEDLGNFFGLNESKSVQLENQNPTELKDQTGTSVDLQVESLMVSSYDSLSGKTLWKCAQCDYSPKHKNTLKEHVETHIQGIQKECALCEKTFSTTNSLRVHKIRTHSNKLKRADPWSQL